MHMLNPHEMKMYFQLQQQLYMGTLPPHCIQMYVYLDTKFNMMRFKPLEAFHPDGTEDADNVDDDEKKRRLKILSNQRKIRELRRNLFKRKQTF